MIIIIWNQEFMMLLYGWQMWQIWPYHSVFQFLEGDGNMSQYYFFSPGFGIHVAAHYYTGDKYDTGAPPNPMFILRMNSIKFNCSKLLVHFKYHFDLIVKFIWMNCSFSFFIFYVFSDLLSNFLSCADFMFSFSYLQRFGTEKISNLKLEKKKNLKCKNKQTLKQKIKVKK